MGRRPWSSPMAFRLAPYSTATVCARRATRSPATGLWCWPRKPACSISRLKRSCRRGRLQPGRMLLVDTQEGRLIGDEEIKHRVAGARPYGEWLERNMIHLADLPEPAAPAERDTSTPVAAAACPGLYVRGLAGASGRPWRATAWSRSGPWAPTRRWRCSRRVPSCSTTTSCSCLRRSRTRPSTRTGNTSSPASQSILGYQRNLLQPGPLHCQHVRLDSPLHHLRAVGATAAHRPARFPGSDAADDLGAAGSPLPAPMPEMSLRWPSSGSLRPPTAQSPIAPTS